MTPKAVLAARLSCAAMDGLTVSEQIEVVAYLAESTGLPDVPAADARPPGRVARRLDNHVMAWWLDWTSRHHTRRDYPDTMTREGVTDYAIRTQSDFETIRLELEAHMRVPGRRYRMRQALMFHDVDGAGTWTFRVRWTDGTGAP
jgi:hypothetical protein